MTPDQNNVLTVCTCNLMPWFSRWLQGPLWRLGATVVGILAIYLHVLCCRRGMPRGTGHAALQGTYLIMRILMSDQ